MLEVDFYDIIQFMKTSVYTYKNKKIRLITLPKFYLLESKQEYKALIDKLLDIDAVFSPAKLTYPAVVRIKQGFGVELEPVRMKDYKQSLRQERHRIRQLIRKVKSI